MSSLMRLPAETLETILIYTAVSGFPTAIAAFAQTCRAHRALVYTAADHHLWREIYLSAFDDPRELRFQETANIDWAKEVQERVWAASFLGRHTHPVPVRDMWSVQDGLPTTMFSELCSSVSDNASVLRALEALLSSAKLSAPVPSSFAIRDDLTNTNNLPGASIDAPAAPPAVPPEQRSRSIAWLDSLLTPYPAFLAARLASLRADPEWVAVPAAAALARLVCFTGFRPLAALQDPTDAIPVPDAPVRRSPRIALAKPPLPFDATAGPAPLVVDMGPAAQRRRARARAREQVYHLHYLLRRRHWGPYRPVAPSPRASPGADPGPGPGGMAVYSDSEYDSEYDPEFRPLEDEDEDGDGAGGGDDSDDSDASSLLNPMPLPTALPVPTRHRPRKRSTPTSSQLYPDWTWLAAARVVVEMNLREKKLLDELELEALCSLEGLREGAWSLPRPDKASEAEMGIAKGKEKEVPQEDSLEGWDWAGIEGVWRRCVCWLDYNDLIHYNLRGGYDDDRLGEATIIVPVRIRIVGYGPPSVPEYPDRPVIKVEGEMGGAFWLGTIGVHDDVRHVHGTVEMIADGNVRWCLYSTRFDDHMGDEWVSEGVQLGGVGSAMGVVGMWTGATHDPDDPLGPFWAWKVA